MKDVPFCWRLLSPLGVPCGLVDYRTSPRDLGKTPFSEMGINLLHRAIPVTYIAWSVGVGVAGRVGVGVVVVGWEGECLLLCPQEKVPECDVFVMVCIEEHLALVSIAFLLEICNAVLM